MFPRVRLALILCIFIFTAFSITTSTSAWAQYATLGPNGGVVLLNAPGVALPAAPAAPKAGISLADKTGISNNSPDTTEVATVGSGGALYNGGAVGNGSAPYNGAALGTTEVPAGGAANGAAVRPKRDLGYSVFVGEGPVNGALKPASGGPTLAEIAAKLKTSQKKSRRTYTNADAQRINDNQQLRQVHTNQPSNVSPPQPR
jgi:hypothetical protein